MYLGGYISQDIFNAAFAYFVVFALGGTTLAVSNLAGLTYAVQTVAVLLAINFALRASPALAYRIAGVSFAIGVLIFLGLWWSGHGASGWIFAIPVVFAGLGRGALNYIPWATYNFMADVDEIVTGRRREGAFAGVMTFVRKMSQAIALIAVGQILQLSGFVAGATSQSSVTVHAIVAVMIGGTLAILAFGLWCRALPPRSHHPCRADGRDRTAARRRHDARHPQSGAIVEDLSGWRYDRLWGRNPVL